MNNFTPQSTNHLEITPTLLIPLNEISFQFTHSSGPGGQHVNKTESKVLLRFNVYESEALLTQLTTSDRERVITKLGSSIDTNGTLQIGVQETRSQTQNKKIALERFKRILVEALKKPKRRKPTRPSRSQNEKRLQSKKRRSQTKANRGRKWD